MKNSILFILTCLSTLTLSAQDFMLQGWYWNYPKTCNGNNWAQTLKDQTNLLQGNFTYVWLPPLSKASFGSCSNGYDPRDLYDLGEYGGPTGFGTRADVNTLISTLSGANIKAVADVVYNHRDGGSPEQNDPVKDYITTHYTASKNPFPSDRFRCIIPLGGSSGNNAGDYYFKVNSKTGDSKFHNKVYRIYVETGTKGWQSQTDANEVEPNCNSNCDPVSCAGNDPGSVFATDITIGRNFNASIDNSTCNTDEYHLTLDAADFDPNGDFLYIYLTNYTGDYSDHRIWGIWRHNTNDPDGADITNELIYQTYTDFTGLPSGQGGMNFENFKPNSTNASTTSLAGDWDWLWFFYDADQDQSNTRQVYSDWTKWLWNEVNIRGYRMDAVKHFPGSFVGDLMNDLTASGINPGLVVGEFFDTDPTKLLNWISSASGSSVPIRAFDFSLRQALKSACDQYGYDARNVFNSGMVDQGGGSGFNAVTFVNNHDYRYSGEPVQNDPMLAYAYILTNNKVGLPCVFYPEYFGTSVQNYPTVNLRTEINELISIHKNYIYESNKWDYLSRINTGYSSNYSSGGETTTLLYQMAGGIAGKDIIVCINFAGQSLEVEHQINGDLDGDGNNLPIGTTFQELTSNANTPTLTLSSNYRVNIEVPARSYAVWAQGVVLPVELVDFRAQAMEDKVQLVWESSSESGFEGYEIERSVDGTNFRFLEKVPAKGNDSAGANYEFFDLAPVRGKTLYYRLKMKDMDGSFSYSPVRTTQLAEPWGKPLVMPNPTNGNSILSFHSPEEINSVLQVFNSYGQLIQSREVPSIKGSNMLELDLRQFPAGVYYIQLSGNRQVMWRERVMKY